MGEQLCSNGQKIFSQIRHGEIKGNTGCAGYSRGKVVPMKKIKIPNICSRGEKNFWQDFSKYILSGFLDRNP